MVSGEIKPSGWIAPSAKFDDFPFFVPRDREHLLPVFLYHYPDPFPYYVTKIKGIEGDLFQMAMELKKFIKDEYKPEREERFFLRLQVYEPHQQIIIKGDWAEFCKEFLILKGF